MTYEDDGYNGDNRVDYLFKGLGLMLLGGVVTAGLLVSFEAWQVGDRFLNALSNLLNAPPPQPKVNVQSVVIQQMRDASELTTAAFTMQAVVPTSQDNTFGGFVFGTTRLLYIAYGEVKAGVDLSQVTPENVRVSGEAIQIQLPPPRILDSKIDVNRSSVYDYSRGMLGLGPDVAPELQKLAQQEALTKVIDAACQDGLLTKASDRAQLVVTQLLNTAGYRQVAVQVQPPAGDACAVGARKQEPEFGGGSLGGRGQGAVMPGNSSDFQMNGGADIRS
ncbi:DUF4230 domain-containing protein [Leptothermofonsia sichuanensis E412]|uniref:DUF4230 domain-containing protein n=1 Tax=Leptothermofonsia sichuanensis TaxID=2917832 RepID=UPI001CA629D4|nr:DUF4230 domain-containing protein [Leptothermofonsia sichuanensis]QZZ20857.1 DUF4230 domain-containing protein [Leptothermofonsia sichuanensis E412]